ncbi:hypothetical protein DFH06DRAFT_1329111 [Mycena polygramma]|nr:hypothetical protein DFH06DRAFT_1329111 [Mycena polygramma]
MCAVLTFKHCIHLKDILPVKEQYGSNLDSSEEHETDSEDSDGEELTPAMDAAILRTLARIKRKDIGTYKVGEISSARIKKRLQSAKAALTRPVGAAAKEPKESDNVVACQIK